MAILKGCWVLLFRFLRYGEAVCQYEIGTLQQSCCPEVPVLMHKTSAVLLPTIFSIPKRNHRWFQYSPPPPENSLVPCDVKILLDKTHTSSKNQTNFEEDPNLNLGGQLLHQSLPDL